MMRSSSSMNASAIEQRRFAGAGARPTTMVFDAAAR